MAKGISLANKCQLLFGFAVLVILAGALAVPWIRTHSLIDDYQVQIARQVSDAWLENRIELGRVYESPSGLNVRFVDINSMLGQESSFLTSALQAFLGDEERTEYVAHAIDEDGARSRQYARPIRESQYRRIRDAAVNSFNASPFDPNVADRLRGILVVDLSSDFARSQLRSSRGYIVTAWLVGGLLAVLVFYFILTKLILLPVRQLRETTEQIQAGRFNARSTIRTGDEFEQLSEAFNAMLDQVGQSQTQLQSMNDSLDLKVNELAEANVGLFESNRLKSEFLANVSHELRTPLNSIVGFAELLDDMATTEDGADPKRSRYLNNIIHSSRSLQEMINELLDMAKIEAGRMEINIEPTSISDLAEGLAGIMRPQAEAKSITLDVQLGKGVPIVETDPGKLQQILYNFLSNAIKFTPPGGLVTLSAKAVRRRDNTMGVRMSVTDTGPGIPEDMQDVIFDKFRQVDASHTRAHAGTGLGLAICRELADLLGAVVSFTSEVGVGATFVVDLPQTHQPDEPLPLMA